MKKNKLVKKELYNKLDAFTACSIVENFFNESWTFADEITAWQWLKDTGVYKQLQGWYSRAIEVLISRGLVI